MAPTGMPEVRDLIKSTISDRSAWPHLLERASTLIPSVGAWLVPDKDITADVPKSASLDGMLREYFGVRWFEVDRLYEKSIPRFAAGQPIVASRDICDDHYFERNQFHNEFARKHDLQSFMGVSFQADDRIWAISFLRSASQGHYTDAEREAAAALIGDLSNAATVMTLLGREAVGALHRTLDLADTAAVALDARGAVVHANERWSQLLPELGGDLGIGRSGRIVARDRSSQAAIDAAIARASAPGDDATVTSLTIARREGRPVVAKAVPVKCITCNPFAEAKLVLAVTDAGPRLAVTAERIRDVLKVTPAESRLLRALSEGATVTSAAASLGIAKATARTQLKSVYGKIDVHNQRELLQVLRQI